MDASRLALIVGPFTNVELAEATAYVESLERALGRGVSLGEAEGLLFHVSNIKGAYEDLVAILTGDRVGVPSGYDDFAETGFVTFAKDDSHLPRALAAYEWEQENGRRWPGAPGRELL